MVEQIPKPKNFYKTNYLCLEINEKYKNILFQDAVIPGIESIENYYENNEHKIDKKLEISILELKNIKNSLTKTNDISKNITYKPPAKYHVTTYYRMTKKYLEDNQAFKEFEYHKQVDINIKGVIICNSAEEAMQNADILVIATPWQEFKKLEVSIIRDQMKGNIIIY